MADPDQEQTTTTDQVAVIPPTVDVQAAIATALSQQEAKFSEQLQKATGHSSFTALEEARLVEAGETQTLLDAKTAENTALKQQFHSSQINNSILAASGGAINPEMIVTLLSGAGACDEAGVVTIGSKTAADAVVALLEENPNLALPVGGDGSGVPQQVVLKAQQVNPFAQESFNLTEQFRLKREDPALAETLKKAATPSQ